MMIFFSFVSFVFEAQFLVIIKVRLSVNEDHFPLIGRVLDPYTIYGLLVSFRVPWSFFHYIVGYRP